MEAGRTGGGLPARGAAVLGGAVAQWCAVVQCAVVLGGAVAQWCAVVQCAVVLGGAGCGGAPWCGGAQWCAAGRQRTSEAW
ncbi:hypothetical protein GCM10023167_01880 [Brevibacterium pityocampae]|uniref:Uncharacterized protein n=1 Tax=Brevibacterium pityocampae TaxID=506594 RepID=A0ABP8J0S7_9MICO